jgi:hypothetical protein
MEEALVNFAKWSIIELACNSELDNRGYSICKEKPSNLKEAVKRNNNDFEKAVAQVIRVLTYDAKFINLSENYVSEEDEDDKDEIFEDLFNFIVERIGLYQINSLHHDSRDRFQSKLKELLE